MSQYLCSRWTFFNNDRSIFQYILVANTSATLLYSFSMFFRRVSVSFFVWLQSTNNTTAFFQTYLAYECVSASDFNLCLPPSVADNRKCVPYFLMRLSVMVWVVGLRPRSRMFLMNSGVNGSGDSRKSLRSTAKLFTFHLPNSLKRINRQKHILKLFLCENIDQVRQHFGMSYYETMPVEHYEARLDLRLKETP